MAPSCSSLPFFSVAWWWLPLMLAAAAAEPVPEPRGGDCSPKICGGLNISDPFWLTNWGAVRPCGSSDFEVTCENGTIPVLRSSASSGVGFAIVNISYQEQNLLVVDHHKELAFDDSNGCPGLRTNSSVELAIPFTISPTNLNLVFYNCTKAAAEAEAASQDPELLPINCGNRTDLFVRLLGGYEEDYAMQGCTSTFLPAFDKSGNANASDYQQLINDGFLLTWQPPLCDSCAQL